jgi:hypothetical protein
MEHHVLEAYFSESQAVNEKEVLRPQPFASRHMQGDREAINPMWSSRCVAVLPTNPAIRFGHLIVAEAFITSILA